MISLAALTLRPARFPPVLMVAEAGWPENSLPPPDQWVTRAKLSVEPPEERDRAIVEGRQLGHAVSMVAVGRRCRHGVPQAFVWNPSRRHTHRKSGDKFPLEGGLFRLSCPLLVKAIDEWEAEGAVNEINSLAAGTQTFELQQRPLLADTALLGATTGLAASDASSQSTEQTSTPQPTPLATALADAHNGHAMARLAVMGEARVRELLAAYPLEHEYGPSVRLVLLSGVAGHVPSKLDIKCGEQSLPRSYPRSAELPHCPHSELQA